MKRTALIAVVAMLGLGATNVQAQCFGTDATPDPEHPLNCTAHDWGRVMEWSPTGGSDESAPTGFEWYDGFAYQPYGPTGPTYHGAWLDPGLVVDNGDGTYDYSGASATAVIPEHYLSWNAETEHRCEICHTPHNAQEVAAPLWSHDMSTAVYTLYGTAFESGALATTTLTASPSQPTSGKSAACLACHDGTVAVNAYTYTGDHGAATAAGDHFIGESRSRFIGTDLRDDHPIALTYDHVADAGLLDPNTHNVSTLRGDGTVTDMLLYGGQVECMSCHNPHDNQWGAFLVMENRASSLCQACHAK